MNAKKYLQGLALCAISFYVTQAAAFALPTKITNGTNDRIELVLGMAVPRQMNTKDKTIYLEEGESYNNYTETTSYNEKIPYIFVKMTVNGQLIDLIQPAEQMSQYKGEKKDAHWVIKQTPSGYIIDVEWLERSSS